MDAAVHVGVLEHERGEQGRKTEGMRGTQEREREGQGCVATPRETQHVEEATTRPRAFWHEVEGGGAVAGPLQWWAAAGLDR